MSRATLKPIVSELRESIIKGIAGKFEKYGFDENGINVIDKPLSCYNENIKNNIVTLFKVENIFSRERFIEYIHNTSRTFLHILICFKLMEKRRIMPSLLNRVMDDNVYNEIIPNFVNVHPLAFDDFVKKCISEIDKLKYDDDSEEDDEYYQFLYLMERLTMEMAQEVPLLFKDYEHNLIHPDYDDLKRILSLISRISEDEYFEDDFLGWIYQYWVDTEPQEIKKGQSEKDIEIIKGTVELDNEITKCISYNESILCWIQEIYLVEQKQNNKGIQLVSQVSNMITKFIEEEYGIQIVEEIEKEVGKIESIIRNGVKESKKTNKFYGKGFKDLSNPFIGCKKLGGKGKDIEMVIWISTQFKTEFEEDKKYAMQNEIRRLTDEVYIPRLMKLKERIQNKQLTVKESKMTEREIEVVEECIKSLENWKVVD